MGAVNSSGVYVYDTADQVSPIHTFANLQASALTARLNAQFATVTSTTRPVSPFANQLIFESDTQTYRVYRASDGKWVSIPYRNGNIAVSSPEVTGSQTAGVTLARAALTAVNYSRTAVVTAAVGGNLPNASQARLTLGYDPGSFTDSVTPQFNLQQDLVQNISSGTIVNGMSVSHAGFNIGAGSTPTIRAYLSIPSGSFSVSDLVGYSLTVLWTETSSVV